MEVAPVTKSPAPRVETYPCAAGNGRGGRRGDSSKLRIFAVAFTWFALAIAPGADALTLQDLNAGAAFGSSDSTLTFEFDAGSIIPNGLPGSLVDYLVTPIVGGFQISGPAAALNGSLAGLTLSYAVTAGMGLVIDGAALLVTGTALGTSAAATVGETLSNGAGLSAAITSFGGSQLTDSASFAGTGSLDVVTGLQLLALGGGDIASIQTLRQTFLVSVPELETGMLLAVGLLGLALFGSPQRAMASGRSQRG
jgi:hypothetical protein